MSWHSQIAKSLFIFIFLFFSFLFILLKEISRHMRGNNSKDVWDFINRSKYKMCISSVTNFIWTITPGILDRFQRSKWPLKALKKNLQNCTKNISKWSVFTKLSADQSVITKSPDTKLLISQELLSIIVCFNDHHEALFNALLLAINRSKGNKIPWRYKVLNVCT